MLAVHADAMGLTTKDRYKSDSRVAGSRKESPEVLKFSHVSKGVSQVINVEEWARRMRDWEGE